MDLSRPLELGSTLDVCRLRGDGAPAAVLGQARLVQPDLAQALPPLDATLAATTDDTLALTVRRPGDDADVDVRNFYVGLVSPSDAVRIVNEEDLGLPLVEDAGVLVFLGLTRPLASQPSSLTMAPKGSAAMCRIVCLWYCANC